MRKVTASSGEGVKWYYPRADPSVGRLEQQQYSTLGQHNPQLHQSKCELTLNSDVLTIRYSSLHLQQLFWNVLNDVYQRDHILKGFIRPSDMLDSDGKHLTDSDVWQTKFQFSRASPLHTILLGQALEGRAQFSLVQPFSFLSPVFLVLNWLLMSTHPTVNQPHGQHGH